VIVVTGEGWQALGGRVDEGKSYGLKGDDCDCDDDGVVTANGAVGATVAVAVVGCNRH
jgi:hypothetical protein